MTIEEAIETLEYEIDEECHCEYIADEIHLLIDTVVELRFKLREIQLEQGRQVNFSNTNYDRIRNMNVEELAEGIATLLFAHLNKFNIGIGNPPQTMTEQEKAETKNAWLEWLESEVTEE